MTTQQNNFIKQQFLSIVKEDLANKGNPIDPCSELKDILSEIEQYPHTFVLACLMDRQIKAEDAWKIPAQVYEHFKCKSITDLAKIPKTELIDFFKAEVKHRYKKDQAQYFYSAIHTIVKEYNGDASKIWKGKPSSAAIVSRFLKFEGCGIKIATMAANILHRDHGVEYSDYYSIDISPDVHVRRIFERLKLINEGAKVEQIIYCARDINPEYPGILDAFCWNLGQKICHESNPKCQECPLKTICQFYKNVSLLFGCESNI